MPESEIFLGENRLSLQIIKRRPLVGAGCVLLRRLVVAEPDHAQFIQLLVRHEHDLLRFVLPLVGNLADARDVMQEAAVNLWKKFDEYDPSQPFLPWARRFAYFAA